MSVQHRLHDMGDVWRVVSLVRGLPKTNQTGEALLMLADHVERLEREQRMLVTEAAQENERLRAALKDMTECGCSDCVTAAQAALGASGEGRL